MKSIPFLSGLLLLNLLLLQGICAWGQNGFLVKGKIISETEESIPGATIRIKNTNTGVISDLDGGFQVSVPDKKSVLVISFVGYLTQEVVVGDQTYIELKLLPDVQQLSEVVVTGYTKQSKRDVTGAVSVVKSDVISRTPSSDLGNILQGRVSGVSVDAQGGPGSLSKVRIRGFGTNGNNDVLYVIDGVQMRGGSNLFNVNDVETVTVLKDPSTTSLYGAQGGNGVIVITTKKGKFGAPKLEYSTYLGWENPIKYPNSLSPQKYADAYWAYLKKSGLPLKDLYYGQGESPVLPDYIIERQTGAPLIAFEGDPIADPALFNLKNYRILKMEKEGTDWFREVLGPAFTQNHQLNLSGATELSNYSLGFNYLDNTGVLMGTYFKRYSIRLNTEFTPRKWIKVGQNISFSYSEGQNVTGGNHNPQGIIADLYQRSPLMPVRDIAGNYSGPKGIPDNIAFHPGGNNPVLSQENIQKNHHSFTSGAIGSAFIQLIPVKNVTIESKIGFQFYPYSYRYFLDTIPQNVYTSPYNSFSEGGGWSADWRWLNKMSYELNINENHKLNAFIAYESRQYMSRWYGGTTPNLPYTIPSYLNLSNGVPNLNGGPYNMLTGGSDEATNTSLFGNLNYSLFDKYLFGFVLRRDGSSKFGPLSRYGNFPSVSVGWRISDEYFMNELKWIDDLKIRFAVGTNGNDAIPSGLFLNQYNTNPYSSSYDLGGLNDAAQTGAGLFQIGNPYIQWETNKTINVGFDAGLFKNQLNLSFSWFDRKTEDLLGVPPMTGLAGDALPPYENIIEFSNKGIELEMAYKNELGKLHYDMNIGISTYRNNVDYLDGDPDSHLDGNSYAPTHFSLTRSVVGRPVSSFYGYVQEGIFQSEEDYEAYGVDHPGLNNNNAAGHFKFKDISGPEQVPDGKIDENDRTFIGSPHPKFTYGVNINLIYGNIDLGVFIQGSYGNDIFNYWRAFTVFPGAMGEGSDEVWSLENPDAKLPVWDKTASYDKMPSSFFVEDGSYLRLKNLQIGYTVTNSHIFDKLRIYLQAGNLVTITKYQGIDPEVSTGNATNAGVDFGGNYPITRNLILGLNISL